MAPDVMEDIEELRELLRQSKRPRVQAILSAEIDNLQKGSELPSKAEVQQPLEKIAAPPPVSYTTLDSFSWAQDENNVKIYISVEGASSEMVSSKFAKDSFEVKIHGLGGKNFRCAVAKLNKPIDPDQSSVLIKPKRITVVLRKKEKGTWTDLHLKEDKLKPKMDEKTDPMAGIMDMMKNLYDDGDETMKQAIAQAWTEARTKKSGNPLGV